MAKSCCRMELVWQQDGRIGRFVERCVCHAAQNGATSERAQFYHAVALRKMIGGPRFVAAYKDVTDLINDPWQWPPSLSWLLLTLLEPHLDKRKRLIVTAFLFQNGVSPYWIRVFYRANSSLRDDAAWRDVESLLKQLAIDESRGAHKFYAFDLLRGCVCWLDGTPRDARHI